MTTSTLPSATATPSKGAHYGLWAVQGLLGLAFVMAGQMKLFTGIPELAKMLPWASSVPEALVRFIGASELLGGLGLILPAATRIKPMLTPLAAAGLVLVMVLAAGFHATRGEFGALPINLVLGGLAGFVAWGRVKLAPIAPRS
ncbi:MAG: DoxX family protein [Archangium sp.]|nr:DoxX family protein [Archangium sp.]